MTVFSHYNRSRAKKRSYGTLQRAKITKGTVLSLLLIHYNMFMRSLLKESNAEARDKRSKITRGEHVQAVVKKVLKKYRG